MFDAELRLDMLVNNTIVVELKAVEKTLPVDEAQNECHRGNLCQYPGLETVKGFSIIGRTFEKTKSRFVFLIF